MPVLRLQNRRLSKKLGVLNEDSVYSWVEFRIRDRILSLRGWISGEIPWRWWLVLIIGDENVDDSVSVSTYSQRGLLIQIQAKPTTRLLLRKCSYWRNKAQNIDVLGYCLTFLCPCGQIVWSPFPYPITSHERGVATERGGGFRSEYYSSQILTIKHT